MNQNNKKGKLPIVLSGVVAAEVLVVGAAADAVLAAPPPPPSSFTYDAGNHPICLFFPFA